MAAPPTVQVPPPHFGLRDGPLDPDQVVALLAGDPAPLPAALTATGLPESHLADAVGTCADALTAPAVSFSLRLRQGGEEQTIFGRAAASVIAVATVPNEPRGRLIVGPSASTPQLLSLLVQLREHPEPEGRVDAVLQYAPVDAFAGVGLDEATLADLHETLDDEISRDTLAAILGEQSLRWTLSLWAGADTTTDSPARLDVIDAFDGGLWVIDEGPEPGTVLLRPIDADVAWFFLTRELAAPLT